MTATEAIQSYRVTCMSEMDPDYLMDSDLFFDIDCQGVTERHRRLEGQPRARWVGCTAWQPTHTEGFEGGMRCAFLHLHEVTSVAASRAAFLGEMGQTPVALE